MYVLYFVSHPLNMHILIHFVKSFDIILTS